MHVQRLPIASASTDGGGHNHQLVLRNKVPDAALFARRLVARMGLDVEFQRGDKRQEESEEELECEEHIGVSRLEAAVP